MITYEKSDNNVCILPPGILNFLDDYEREVDLIEQQIMNHYLMMCDMYYSYYYNYNY